MAGMRPMMRDAPVLPAIIAVFLAFTGPLAAQGDSGSKCQQVARETKVHGYFAPQIRTALASLSSGSRGNQEQVGVQAETMLALANHYRDAGAFKAAEICYTQAAGLLGTISGPRSTGITRINASLAELYRQLGRYREAEALLQSAHDIQSRALASQKENPANLASTLIALAKLKQDLARSDQAGEFADRALALESRLGPEASRLIADAVTTKGALQIDQARHAAAGELLRRGLQMRRDHLDAGHPDIGQSLNLLGLLALNQGHHERAEELFRQALQMFESALLDEHPLIGAAKTNLGRVFLARKQFGIADDLFAAARMQIANALGQRHSWLASVYLFQATSYRLQRNFALSGPLYERAIEIFQAVLGPSHPQIADFLHNLGRLHAPQGRLDDALKFYQRALRIRERIFGGDSLQVADSLNFIGLLLARQDKAGQAVAMYRRSIAIRKARLGDAHHLVAITQNNLAILLKSAGKFNEAESLFNQSLGILQKALGANHPSVATTLINIGDLKSALAQYSEAERLLKRALAIREATVGESHPDTSVVLNNLAGVHQKRLELDEANRLYLRVLKIRENAFGSNDHRVATALNNLASLRHDQGRYQQAKDFYSRALAIRRNIFGSRHALVALTLNNLATVLQTIGRYDQAEKMFAESHDIWKSVLGPSHPQLAISLLNTSALYQAQGRLDDAEPLLKRSLAIRTKYYGIRHPETIVSLNNLAVLYDAQGRPAEAEKLLFRVVDIRRNAPHEQRLGLALALNNLGAFLNKHNRQSLAEQAIGESLEIRQSMLPVDHPDIGVSLGNLAQIYLDQMKYSAAEGLFERSIRIAVANKGDVHPSLASVLNNLAILKEKTNRPEEARTLYERSLAIKSAAFGSTHPSLVTTLSNIADLYFQQRNWRQATAHYRKATDIISHRTRVNALATGKPLTGQKQTEAAQAGLQFSLYVKAAYRDRSAKPDTLHSDMFKIAQRGAFSRAASSLAQMAARHESGDSALAKLVRNRQDLVFEWQRLDNTYTTAVAQAIERRNPAAEEKLRARLRDLDRQVARMDARLADAFPQFSAIANPAALSVQQAQSALKPDEALLFYLDTPSQEPLPEETFVWIVTRDDSMWFRSSLGAAKLIELTAKLRRSLGVSSATTQRSVILSVDSPAPRAGYDFATAHKLYEELVKPAERMIRSKTHLIVVPSGALTSLPFQLITTAQAKQDAVRKPWLIRRFAITTAPSVSSLSVLRSYARAKQAPLNFIAFANPVFRTQGGRTDGPAASDNAPLRRSNGAATEPAPGVSRFFRGGRADPGALASLAQLPDTADEVDKIAELFRSNTRIYLGRAASETTVKQANLAAYRVVHFATHGLVAGEIANLAMPALALSAPASGTELDDGLLTSSEIAALKLNADWVILSACNTAAGDRPGAPALSGLANAFFYAGARSLLVSHWPVVSSAAVKLTTATFRERQQNPGIGKSEALRKAMLALADSSDPADRDPAYWAPFVVVGEGYD